MTTDKLSGTRTLGRAATSSIARKVAEAVLEIGGPLAYAGVGSRETPEEVLGVMASTAEILAGVGMILRSGGAAGADSAFASGVAVPELAEIFRPEDATEQSVREAEKYHPAWHRCNYFARRAHGRNCMIVLGRDLNSPVRVVVCWTKHGRAVGGTGQVLRLAARRGIPIINLAAWRPSGHGS